MNIEGHSIFGISQCFTNVLYKLERVLALLRRNQSFILNWGFKQDGKNEAIEWWFEFKNQNDAYYSIFQIGYVLLGIKNDSNHHYIVPGIVYHW